MSYTSDNKAPTLMSQAPNRKGNVSKHLPGKGGVTAVTRPSGGVAYAAGHQGAPSVGGNPTSGRGQKVMVSCHHDYAARNDGYLKNSSFKG